MFGLNKLYSKQVKNLDSFFLERILTHPSRPFCPMPSDAVFPNTTYVEHTQTPLDRSQCPYLLNY